MKATIVNTVDNTTKVVDLPSAVTDLSDLKHFLNITEGQFFEGTTHTDLTSNSQSIPAIPAEKADKGYVFFVSPAQNKFKNGALSRKECYDYIKSHNLGDAVKDKFGKNFTQVSNADLNTIIAMKNHNDTCPSEEVAPVTPAYGTTEEETPANVVNSYPIPTTEKELWKALLQLLTTTNMAELNNLRNVLSAGVDKVFASPYSVQDLANMRNA